MRLRSLGAWVRTWGMLLALCLAWPAQAGLVLTVTASGKVVDGADSGALTGAAFSVPSDDVSITMTQVFEEGPGSTLGTGFGDFSLASVTFFVTIGSAQSTTSFTPGSGIVTVLAAATPNLGSFLASFTALSGDLNANVSVESSSILSDALTQSFSFSSGDAGSSVISFGASYLGDYFRVDEGRVTVEARNDVPEPSTVLLAAMALGVCRVRRVRLPRQRADR